MLLPVETDQYEVADNVYEHRTAVTVEARKAPGLSIFSTRLSEEFVGTPPFLDNGLRYPTERYSNKTGDGTYQKISSGGIKSGA
jgi:hypothetical protein